MPSAAHWPVPRLARLKVRPETAEGDRPETAAVLSPDNCVEVNAFNCAALSTAPCADRSPPSCARVSEPNFCAVRALIELVPSPPTAAAGSACNCATVNVPITDAGMAASWRSVTAKSCPAVNCCAWLAASDANWAGSIAPI